MRTYLRFRIENIEKGLRIRVYGWSMDLNPSDFQSIDERLLTVLKRSIVGLSFLAVICVGHVTAADDKCVPIAAERGSQDLQDWQEARLELFGVALECLKNRTGRELGSIAITNFVPGLYLSLPVKFEPFREISIDLIRSDPVAVQSLDGTFAGVLRAFNVQVVARNKELIWPEEVTMVFTLTKENHVIPLETPMRQENDGTLMYVFDDPIATLRLIEDGIAKLGRLSYSSFKYEYINPELEIKHISGFEDVLAQAFDSNFPRGEPVTYSYRLGITRLTSRSYFLGRPHELVSVMPQFELFQ